LILINKVITTYPKVYFCTFKVVELAFRLVGVIKLDSFES